LVVLDVEKILSDEKIGRKRRWRRHFLSIKVPKGEPDEVVVGNKIASGFGLGLAVLLVSARCLMTGTTKVSSSAEWVRHTHEVLTGLEGLLSGIKDAETGQRGYVITGESRYLEPYNTARDLVDQKLNPCEASPPTPNPAAASSGS